MGPSVKTQKASAPPPTPTIDDADQQSQDELEKFLKRKGRMSTQVTGAGGAALQNPTTAAQLFGF